MDILVAILIIAVIAAVVYAVVQRRQVGAPGLQRPQRSPIARPGRGAARHDPMAAAVAEHAQAMDPADVVVAEQRLQAQARNVAAGMQAGTPVHQPIPGQAYPAGGAPVDGVSPTGPGAVPATDPSLDGQFDPVTGERIDGYGDPANDPRYDDRRYDGRLAADWVDPREDDRAR
ncbi:MAG: hypothetical protein QOG15_373 [Solirubrobacteraceae bacterium]|jgi:hypothetical protein|nr:hypothetical protein [Solirubrobacteraceae bacterium]